MRRAVIDLASRRPLWSLPEEAAAAIRRAFGKAWEVVQVRTPASSDGDGGVATAEAVAAAAGAEVYIGWGVPVEVARAAGRALQWAHTASAGVRGALSPAFRATGAVLTNSRGVHAAPMADWVVAAVALCLRGFLPAIAAQRERRWIKDAFTEGRIELRELSDARVGLVGLGGIGRAVARRCAALGMDVWAVRRRARSARVRGVSWLGGPDDLMTLARGVHVLVIAAPETEETRGLVDSRVLSALPAGAFVVNCARGSLLDEPALRAHLEAGHLGGAVLDVFGTEPLPPEHPFWSDPRVLMTPHVSAVTRRFWERETRLIVENVDRYLHGRRLRNVVRPSRGY